MSIDRLGPVLRDLRMSAGMTASWAGRQAGMPPGRLLAIEAGATDVTLVEVVELARVYDSSPDEIRVRMRAGTNHASPVVGELPQIDQAGPRAGDG